MPDQSDNDNEGASSRELNLDPHWDALISNPELRKAFTEAEEAGLSQEQAHVYARLKVFGEEVTREKFDGGLVDEVVGRELDTKNEEQNETDTSGSSVDVDDSNAEPQGSEEEKKNIADFGKDDRGRYETESGREFTGRQLGYMVMHGDAVPRDGELYVDGEQIEPVESEAEEDSKSAGEPSTNTRSDGQLQGNMNFEKSQGNRYEDILNFLSPPDGTPTSSAKLAKELEWDPQDVEKAVKDLIAFGELELVNVSQHGRVRLRQPIPSTRTQASLADLTEYVWHAYITERDGLGRTRARRLFNDREIAEEHLKQIANIETLTSVPGVTKVWCASIGSKGYTPEYAVLRREPIFQQADNPYSKSEYDF